MSVTHCTSIVRDDSEGSLNPSDARPIPHVPPKVSGSLSTKIANQGVSTKYASKKAPIQSHWFALRTTYGREKKAYDYLINKNVTAFFPTQTYSKLINGKRTDVVVSRIPNIFFAYGTEDEIKSYVYDNVHLPYLRFYYSLSHSGKTPLKHPLVIPDEQIESLKVICAVDSDDIIITNNEIPQFREGQKVRIINGKFSGVTGIVGRYSGQRRVAVVVPGLLTICTAYIPGAFLEVISEK